MLKSYSVTDIGKKRIMNQDFVFTKDSTVGNLPNLYIVADGMGGHNGGGYASAYAVEVISQIIMNSKESNPEKLFGEAISVANKELRKKARTRVELEGMGTTAVVASCQQDCLTVANVGDSRLYVINDEINQITIDHSYVEEMIRMGQLDRESARTHPKKNIITRALGAETTVTPDYFKVTLEPGSYVLMCTDGLTNMLSDAEILKVIKAETDLEEKANELVRIANENGGQDNISIVLVAYCRE